MAAPNTPAMNVATSAAASASLKRAREPEQEGTRKKQRKNHINPIGGPIATRPGKRKVALFLSFNGNAYYGMQYQKDEHLNTIERELWRALGASGAVRESSLDVNKPSKFAFQRASRTDKRVSAVGMVCSLKMMVDPNDTADPPAVIQRINSHLPDDIRVHGYHRTTKSFNSKKYCDSRKYQYLIPAFAFAPSSELALPGVTRVQAAQAAAAEARGADPSTDDSAVLATALSDAAINYELPADRLEVVRSIFQQFVGTHNFHNFTTRRCANDPSAVRHIKSFDVSDPFVPDILVDAEGAPAIPFLRISVHGDSFMLHQIRRMIGVVYGIMRLTDAAHDPDRVHAIVEGLFTENMYPVPRVPGNGLFLYECVFGGYNLSYADHHGPLSLDPFREKAHAFRDAQIEPPIIRSEVSQKVPFFNWMTFTESGSMGPAFAEVCRAIETNTPYVDRFFGENAAAATTTTTTTESATTQAATTDATPVAMDTTPTSE